MKHSGILRAVFALGLGIGTACTASAAIDNDLDGFDSTIDCNDNNPTVYPGAIEIVGDSIDQDCDAHEICYRDQDDDGARTSATLLSTDIDCFDVFEATASDPLDCDDANAAVHPGAVEICDAGNTDEDCDGLADDADPGAIGKTTFYTDADGDAYGAGGGTARCDAGPGLAATGDDCDDTNAAVNPAATEVCDVGDVDEDCDNGADDLDAQSAVGKTSWYADSDADGYGDSSSAVQACDSPPGRTATAGDCDDGDAAVNPSATEICDAADADEDCDTLADDADPSATGKTSWYADSDADGYGDSSSSQQACNPPPSRVADATDCDDTDATVHPGATEVCGGGKDDDCDTLVDCADSSCSADASCTTVVLDHLECFKIKTIEKLKGTVDLDPGTHPPFTLAAGCTIGKASKYCVPVTKTVTHVDTTLVPDPSFVGQDLSDDRICYKVKCPDTAMPAINVHDQFGTRSFEKFKVSEICTPAQQVP